MFPGLRRKSPNTKVMPIAASLREMVDDRNMTGNYAGNTTPIHVKKFTG